MEQFIATNLGLIGQLLLAVVLGGLIGVERSLVHKTAGLRTFALVALGSAAFTIIGLQAAQGIDTVGAFEGSARIISQVVLGIGFLGGGLIIFNKGEVQGLTTSAGLWVAGAMGMAVGFKFYTLAVLVTALTLIVFTFFWVIETTVVRKIGAKGKNPTTL